MYHSWEGAFHPATLGNRLNGVRRRTLAGPATCISSRDRHAGLTARSDLSGDRARSIRISGDSWDPPGTHRPPRCFGPSITVRQSHAHQPGILSPASRIPPRFSSQSQATGQIGDESPDPSVPPGRVSFQVEHRDGAGRMPRTSDRIRTRQDAGRSETRSYQEPHQRYRALGAWMTPVVPFFVAIGTLIPRARIRRVKAARRRRAPPRVNRPGFCRRAQPAERNGPFNGTRTLRTGSGSKYPA